MRTQYEIYITENLITGKKYIGLHSKDAKSGESYLGSGVLLLKAVSKYGRDNFNRQVITTTTDLLKANELERELIKKYNAVDSDEFYNLSYGGEYISGRIHSKETIKKIRKSKLENYKDNPELKHKVGSSNRGKSINIKTKNALLKSLTGRKCSNETRLKMSESAFKRYETDGLQYPSLKNRVTGEVIEAGINLSKLARELGVSKSNLSMVISGKRKSCNNWEVL